MSNGTLNIFHDDEGVNMDIQELSKNKIKIVALKNAGDTIYLGFQT